MSEEITGLSKDALDKYIPLDVIHLTQVDSTNTYAKLLAQSKKATSPIVVIADTQEKGRGRLGRSFFSEGGTGLYMSILLFPKLPPQDIQHITTAAAASVCKALEELTGLSPAIKWVNDVYLNGKKIAGILTEGSFDPVMNRTDFAVLGIGVNVFAPSCDFPEDIRYIASSVFNKPYQDANKDHPYFREMLAGKIIGFFLEYFENITNKPHLEDYRSRMFLNGKQVDVITPISHRSAKVIELLPDFSLLVEYPSGEREALFSGEVSLKVTSDLIE